MKVKLWLPLSDYQTVDNWKEEVFFPNLLITLQGCSHRVYVLAHHTEAETATQGQLYVYSPWNYIYWQTKMMWHSIQVVLTRVIPSCNYTYMRFQFINIFVQMLGDTRPSADTRLAFYKSNTYTGNAFGHHFVSILKFGSLITRPTWAVLKMLINVRSLDLN